MAILLDPKGQSITIKIKKIREEDAPSDEFDFHPKLDDSESNDNLPVNYSSTYGPHIKQL